MGKASPTALRKELNTTSLENREKMAIEKKWPEQKQELEYDPEAVAKRLSKYKMNAVGEADMVARECILIGYS